MAEPSNLPDLDSSRHAFQLQPFVWKTCHVLEVRPTPCNCAAACGLTRVNQPALIPNGGKSERRTTTSERSKNLHDGRRSPIALGGTVSNGSCSLV